MLWEDLGVVMRCFHFCLKLLSLLVFVEIYNLFKKQLISKIFHAIEIKKDHIAYYCLVLINKKNTARFLELCDKILYRQLLNFLPKQMSTKGLKLCP